MRPLPTNWFDSGITDALRRLGLLLRKSQQPSPSWLSSGTLEEAAATFSPPSLKAAAAHRVCYGAELEAVAVAAATKLCSTNRANLNPNPNPNPNCRQVTSAITSYKVTLLTSQDAPSD